MISIPVSSTLREEQTDQKREAPTRSGDLFFSMSISGDDASSAVNFDREKMDVEQLLRGSSAAAAVLSLALLSLVRDQENIKSDWERTKTAKTKLSLETSRLAH